MGKMADRKPKLSFGAATKAALRDNTIGEPAKPTPITQPEVDGKKAPAASKPVSAPKASEKAPVAEASKPRPASMRPTVASDKSVNITLRIQIDNAALIEKADNIASAAGVTLNVALSGFVKAAIDALQSRLKENALDLQPVPQEISPLALYERSMRIRQSDLDRVLKAIDPYGVHSRTRAMSHAVAQLMDADKRI